MRRRPVIRQEGGGAEKPSAHPPSSFRPEPSGGRRSGEIFRPPSFVISTGADRREAQRRNLPPTLLRHFDRSRPQGGAAEKFSAHGHEISPLRAWRRSGRNDEGWDGHEISPLRAWRSGRNDEGRNGHEISPLRAWRRSGRNDEGGRARDFSASRFALRSKRRGAGRARDFSVPPHRVRATAVRSGRAGPGASRCCERVRARPSWLEAPTRLRCVLR